MQEVSKISGMFKALGDEGRLQIMLHLRDGEQTVSNLAQLSESETSLVSHRLKALFTAGLLDKRRDGQQIFYRIRDEHVANIIFNAVDHVTQCDV